MAMPTNYDMNRHSLSALLTLLLLCFTHTATAQWSINAGAGLHTTFTTHRGDAPAIGEDILMPVVFAGASYHVDFFGSDGHFGLTPGLYLWSGNASGHLHTVQHNGEWYDYTPVGAGVQLPLLFTGSIFPRDGMRLTLSLGGVFSINSSRFKGEHFDDNPYIEHMTTHQWTSGLAGMIGLGMDYRHFRIHLGTAIEKPVANKDGRQTFFNLTLGAGYIF